MKELLRLLAIFVLPAPYLYGAEEAPQRPRDLRAHEAVRAGDLNRLRDLYNRGVAFDERDTRGNTALHLAARYGSLALVEFLIQDNAFGLRLQDVNARNAHCYTPLHRAVKAGRFKIVAALVKAGANTNAETCRNATPLYFAAKRGLVRIVRLLLRNRARVDAADDKGVTPLGVAATHNHLRVVMDLVSAGASLSLKSRNGMTPLHFAAYEGHFEIVKFFCAKGADINARDNDQQTPLLWVLTSEADHTS